MRFPFPKVEECAAGFRVSTASWSVEHHRACGGAWASLKLSPIGTNVQSPVFGHEVLRSAVCSSLRFILPDSHSDCFTEFSEGLDTQARLHLEHSPSGAPILVAEGVYRDEKGQTIPVGFRRRTEYLQHGLIWSTLEIMSESGCEGAVEVKALALHLKSGWTDAFVRFHPSQGGGADLLGGQGNFDLRKEGTAFLSRFTPMQMVFKTEARHGLELFPGSDLAQWDCSVKPDAGLGHYAILQTQAGTSVELSPYCMAFRRIPAKVQGRLTFKLGFGLPESTQAEAYLQAENQTLPTTLTSLRTSISDLSDLARSGVELLCYHGSYRPTGSYWKNGSYPPYDEADMVQLRSIVASAQQQKLKIIPRISLREFHPDALCYCEHAVHWYHKAAPSLDAIHHWIGRGESGALMCLRSGWLEWSKRTVDTLLKDIPWDGLALDDCTFYPCCHHEHGAGPFHSDVEEFLEFIFFCRERIGESGMLVLNFGHRPSIIAENMTILM